MLPGVSGSLISRTYLVDGVLRDIARAGGVPARGAHTRLQRWWRRVDARVGPASAARQVLDIAALPLIEQLGYDVLHLEPHGSGFAGLIGRDGVPLAVLCSTFWGDDPDAAWRAIVRAGRNAGVAWGLVCTGRSLRLLDASRTWARRHVEFAFADALNDERSTTLLLVLCAAASLAAGGRASPLDRFVERSQQHGNAVCRSLGEGVFEALSALAAALDRPVPRRARSETTPRDCFDQALTVVYRLLFLLFAESRLLVPTWHQVYRDAYTIDALRRRSARRADAPGLWAALQAITRLARAGCHAGDLVVTPFNGRLFSPRHAPLAERVRVADRVVAAAVLALATRRAQNGRERVAYADLGVEQLGAVYERVLEYEPRRDRGTLTLSRTSTERKSSGSFYTPRAMTEFLVRRTLHPLVAGRTADEILALRIVDPAMGSGAFLVAACRYLADAVERADGCRNGAGGEAARRERRAELRRTVAERCLYGIDLNPTAVQLARLSLWLTTLAADRPLTFLDHHLATGDSLLGASLRDFVRQPPRLKRRRDPDGRALPLFDDDVAAEMASTVLPERLHLALAPSSTAAMVRDKERLLARLGADGTALARWKGAADFWCASWFTRETHSRGVYDDVLAAILAGQGALPERQRHAVTTAATAAAAGARFFHWELEFPEVFHDADGRRRPDGGFDAVLGNPPWDALRADTGDRAARDGAAADRLARLRFFRDSGVYCLQGSGHVNRYQLFLERALQLTRRGGRIGLILPSGLATDQGSAPLRRALLDRTSVERLYGFDNRHLIFPIHRDMRFLLLSATTGARTDGVACAFARSEATWLDGLPDAAAEDPPAARPIALTRRFIERWDADDLSIPLLRDARDLQIAAHALEIAPALGAAAGWHARFGRELNATEDRRHFVAADTPGARRALRVIHGRDLAPFQLRPDGASPRLPAAAARALLDAATTFGRARLAYRDVASATNRLTLIAARLPAGTVSTHTVFCLKTALDEDDQYCLLALLNSLVANYLVRLQVTTHVTAGLMARLPVPRPEKNTARELAALARSLEVTGLDDVDAYARLNAVVARLYALTPEQYEHIVSTFPLLPAHLRAGFLHRHATEARNHGGVL